MLSQRLANIVFAIVMILGCIWFAVVAQGFEAAGLLATSGLPSKFFPQLILGIITLCALIVSVVYWRFGAAGGDDGRAVYNTGGDARRGLLMLAVAIICYLIWKHIGFIPMAAMLGPLSLLAMGIRSAWQYLIVLVLTGLIFLLFTRFLGVQLS